MITKGTKLICCKELLDDFEEHGVDFIYGKEYKISYADKDVCYVETEDGSEISFESIEELKEIFTIQ